MNLGRYSLKQSLANIEAEASCSTEPSLKRALGPWQLVALGIGAIIGAGIFVITGTAAAQHAGPAIVLSFVLSGFACALAALCYAEFASMVPVSGSAYTYSYVTMGELVAWIVGWSLILEYSLATATVAVGWSGYLVSFLADLGIIIPPQFSQPPGVAITLADGTVTQGIVNLPALLGVALVTVLLIIGIRESAGVNSFIVVLKLAVIGAFLFFGIPHVNPDNWHPFIPENTGVFGQFGTSGILAGAGMIFFAYIGFDAVSCAAQEAKNPKKDMPIGILGSLAICTVLYIVMALVLTGIVPYTELNVPDPVAVAVNSLGMPWLAIFVKIGALAGLSSVMLVLSYGQARIAYVMAKDGLLPNMFSRVHPKFQTPHLSTMAFGLIIGIAASFTPIKTLGDLVSIGTLFAFVIVCVGVLYLHYKRPDLHRPFRTPGMPFVPILGVLACLYLMYGLPVEAWERLFIWLAIGLATYWFYGRHRSKVWLKSK